MKETRLPIPVPRYLKLVVPPPFSVDTHGIEKILSATGTLYEPFLCILGARFWHAAHSFGGPRVTIADGASIDEDSIYLVRDFFWMYNMLDNSLWTEENLRRKNSKILLFSAHALKHDDWLRGGFSALRSQSVDSVKDADNVVFRKGKFFEYGVGEVINELNNIVVPIACAKEWLPAKQYRWTNSILLDEPHPVTLAVALRNLNHIYSIEYLHALEVCRVLSERGWNIVSFCRGNGVEYFDVMKDYSFVRTIHHGSWIPFRKILDIYARTPLFFSFFSESYGFPIYENLQIGNGIIKYSENADANALRQMQNAALISLYMSPERCADIICDYGELYKRYALRGKIASESHEKFSTNTFASRLIDIFQRRKLLSPA
jgi:hypothetical protein